MTTYYGGHIDYKDQCSQCKRPSHTINLHEGLCYDCWRKNNPERTCEGCIHVEFSCGEDGEECIDCAKKVNIPLDCYSRDRVPVCEFNVKKVTGKEVSGCQQCGCKSPGAEVLCGICGHQAEVTGNE